MKISAEDCIEWRKNELVNPLSGRKIQKGKGVYKNLEKSCEGKASSKKRSPFSKKFSPKPKKRSPFSKKFTPKSKKRSPKKESPKKQYRKKDSPKKESPKKQYRKKDSPKKDSPTEEGECFAKNFKKTYKPYDFKSYCDPNTTSKIKKALMLQLHPDRNPNCKKTATNLFQTIGDNCQKSYKK